MSVTRLFRRYTVVFGLLGCLWVPIGALNGLFAWRASELLGPQAVAARQARAGGLYGSALHDQELFDYKLALVREARPEVVAIGSSRTLKLRHRFFRRPFITMGGGIHTMQDAYRALQEISAAHPPSLVLLFPDYWWFNAASAGSSAPSAQSVSLAAGPVGGTVPHSASLLPPWMVLPSKWLWQGRVTAGDYWRTVLGRPGRVPYPTYGILALSGSRGYAADGAYYDLQFLAEGHRAGVTRFSVLTEEAAKGNPSFRYGEAVDPQAWALLEEAIRLAAERGVRVIVVAAPVAPSVVTQMRALDPRYAYVEAFRRRLGTLAAAHYDFHDPQRLGLREAQFLDDVHATDAGYAKLIQAISADPASGLAPYVATAELEALISRYGEATTLPIDVAEFLPAAASPAGTHG